MKRGTVIRLVAVFCLCAVSATDAHHSHPYFYDWCKSITIEGRVDSVQWRDPHTLIVLTRDDGSAYTVDWNPASRLTARGDLGPAKAALETGARITVTGNPIRSLEEIRTFFPDYKYEVNPNTIDPALIRRADDSWSWTRGSSDRMSPSLPPQCAE